uniref:COMM domain containing 7 n=1 Tax=Salvator merianae TaxID=96440 RepID=A0A8D0E2Q3_SALMN
MGLLHFTREPVPESLSADLQQFNQLSAQQFSSLTEVLFQFLREPKEVERFLGQLSEFAAVNKLGLGPLKNIVKSLLLVPNGALKRTLSAEQVRADLITLGLSEEKAAYFEGQGSFPCGTIRQAANCVAEAADGVRNQSKPVHVLVLLPRAVCCVVDVIPFVCPKASNPHFHSMNPDSDTVKDIVLQPIYLLHTLNNFKIFQYEFLTSFLFFPPGLLGRSCAC